MSPALSISDFPEFFQAVYGVDPFPWQHQLVGEVDEHRGWPDLFDLPTGTGKTAILDIAVFMLALDAGRSPEERWAARRTVMIVDRRVIVDQAFKRAQHLAKALQDNPAEIVREVAKQLLSLSATGRVPLVATMLRGGVVRDDSWVRTPDQPLIIASTVDQVGSRLLFQGYGLSEAMRPIHAGLLANDSLLVLDEVHLSEPFAETLRAIRERYQASGTETLPNRWYITELSATSSGSEDRGDDCWVFKLDHGDQGTSGAAPWLQERLRESNKTLQQRLCASKVAYLAPIRISAVDEERARSDIAEFAMRKALTLCEKPDINAVAVVLNRVDTAQKVMEKLKGLIKDDLDLVLLTGRMRGVERDPVLEALAARLEARSTEDAPDHSLIVVSTQCIEAGADFDFDGLITECASIDALCQRFGRVDRVGRLAKQGSCAEAVIIGPSAYVAEGATDPIYGEALAATWRWLEAVSVNGTVDFGISVFDRPDDPGLRPKRDHAPHLLPSHLETWIETPLGRRANVPAVASWLHGSDQVDIDVQVVWRADLTEGLLRAAVGEGQSGGGRSIEGPLQLVRDILIFCRPLSDEAVPVPISAVRRWLKVGSEAQSAVGDVEGLVGGEDDSSGGIGRPFVIWNGDESLVSMAGSDVYPGCTVVVPSTYGGLARASFEGNGYSWWSPAAKDPVSDLGDLAHDHHGGQVVRRFLPVDTPGVREPYVKVPVPGDNTEGLDDWDHLSQGLDNGSDLLMSFPEKSSTLRSFEIRLDDSIGISWYAVSRRTKLKSADAEHGSDEGHAFQDLDSEPETSSFTGGTEAELGAHLEGVGGKARAFARSCGLPENVAFDLGLAGELHDLGKADERFQAWLRGGIRRAEGQSYLAKSAVPAFDRKRREDARRSAGYPQGGRHEALSLALIQDNREIETMANDWELVKHLVSCHHGWGRPFFPAVVDLEPQTVTYSSGGVAITAESDHGLARLDSGVADRFWELGGRYGLFQLAWLEAFIRLADHRRSEEEQQKIEGSR